MPINPKVKQIYDTLKDGGADVGSEKEFNDYFFAKGKDGYNNRKEVFNTLREGGADAGKSYEEFSGWLGLHAVKPKPTQTRPTTPVQAARPVPAQPARQQKPQDRPMTAAEKARMISNIGGIVRGTQAGLRRTQNMMTYAKKKTGLHVEPVKLGQKPNVVETARQYDPKTGKMQPHYLTEAGNEYDDKAQADMEQAAIDEQKRRELDPVQSQLEDAYGERDRLEEAIRKRRKELEDEYNSRPWYQRMLTEMGKAAHSDMDPAVTATDPEHMGFEQDEQYMQLMSAIRKNHQTIQTLEDKKNGRMNSFWHSLGTALTNGYTFADGLPEMRDATAMLNAQKHIDSINRKRQTGQALTKEEEAAEAVLRNTMTDNAVQGTYGSEYGAWGRAGSGMAQSIDFMKDFLLLPGAGSIAKGVAGKVAGAGGKYLAKEAGETAVKAAAKAIARATLKATGVVAGAHAAGAVISNTTGIGRTAAKMGQLGTGDVGIDKNGNYRMENQKDLMRAFAEAEREQARENGSEMFGEFIPGGKALSGVAKKTLSKIGLGKISDMLTGIGNKAWYKNYTNLLSKGGYNGIPGEALEEYEGMFFDAITGHADEAVQDFTDPKQQVDIWLGCATMGALMGAVPMGLHIQGYYRYKHSIDRADRAADFRLTPEKWQPLKEQIDQTDNGNMSGFVVDNILNNKKLEPQEKEAAMDYVRNLTKFRGFNIAQVNNADEAASGTQAESRQQDEERQQAYETGREAADMADTEGDRSDADAIVLHLREAYGEIERVFGDDAEMRLAKLEDDPWEVMDDQSLTPEQQDAVAYFVNSKAAMDGLNDAANEKGDDKRDEVTRQIEQRTNRQSGMIHPATLKVGDRQVYIVSGNVAMFPDGSAVDIHHSSESVVVCDAETGEMKFISPEQIYKVDEAMDPDIELQAADEAINAERQAILGDMGETPEQVENEQPQQQENVENEVKSPHNETDTQEPSALNRIPKGDNGEPLLEQTDPETAWDGVVEYMEDADDAQEYVESMVAGLTKDVENAKKAVSKVKPSADMAKFKADKAAARQVQADAEERLDKWLQISNVNKTRKQAERNRINIERADAERIAREKAIAELAEQKRVEAEKKAEQEAIGAHAVNPKIKEKWDAAPKAVGNADVITLPDGSQLRGHYVLTEAGAATASHDVNNAYKPTEGFPVDENGQSVNDRDYERDEDARKISRSIADNYDSRALQSVTVVDNNGITLSGNGRNIAGELAAQQGTDGAYIDYLREFPQKYGLTAEQVQSMQHPRVHFVPDEVLPYDAATFARFNAQEMKSQSKPEAAVKLGKVVPDNTFGNIVRSLAQYDRLSDFYANEKDANSAIMELVKAGVVNDKQLPELRTGEALSAAGRELLENTLIGKVFQSNPDAVRQIIAQPGIKQSIVMALSEIAHNRTLANGYDLSEELSNAVDLVARAKHADPDTYKEGMPVSPFGRQQGLFDDELGDSRITDATTLLLADILNSTKPGDLRKVLATYNAEAESAANGQLDIFSGDLRSKEEILKDINQHFINATPKEQQALVDAAIAERKRRAAEAAASEQSGGNGTTEQTAPVETSSGQPQSVPVEGTPIGETSTSDEVQAQRELTETNPTEAQKEAGNYRKGHIKVDGYDIALENPKGSTRSGKDANGKEWSITMKHDYGYIRGTKGTDGDHIDVYLSDNPTAGNVYVVDQINQQTGAFDEHKVMYGFGSMEEAVQAYRDQYEDGWKVGKVTEVSREEFKKWVDSSTRKTKPFAEYKGVKPLDTEHTQSGENYAHNSEEIMQDDVKPVESPAKYTITPTEYTNKKGKTSDMHLVKFNHELSKEEKAAAKVFISEPLTEGRRTPRGWYGREQGGYMVRSEEAARQLGDMMADEVAVADEQPLTVQDYRNAASPAIRNEQEKKPANTVTVEDAAIQDVEAKVYNPEQKKGDLEFNGDVSKEDFNDALKDLRSLLGVSDDEGDVGILFRDDEELTKEQRKKIKAAGLSVTQVLVDNGMVKFPEYAGKMVSLIGDKIRPWLKSFYEGIRWEPGYESVEFTPSDEVAKFDVQNFDKPSPDILKQAEMVVAEQKAAKISKQTEQEVKSERNEKRKEYEKQTEANTAAIAEEAGAVASKARTVAKSATVDTEVREATEKVDATLENVNNQLALLGYYEADAVDKNFNEAYVYMRNADEVQDALPMEHEQTPQPKKVNVESLVRELQEKGKARLSEHAEEVKEKPATPDLHGFNIGDKVMYKGKEATLYDTDNGRPVLDAGLAPVMYEVADWHDLTPVSSATETTPAKEEKASTKKENPTKKNNQTKKSLSLKREPTVGDLFGDLFSNNNLDGKDNDTARTRQAERSSRENGSVGSISADRDGVLDTRSTGGTDGRETARVSDTTGTVADGERKEVSGQRGGRTTSGGNNGDGEAERPMPERGQRIGDRVDADERSAVAGVADESQRTTRPAADTSDQLVHGEARRGERGRNVAKQQEPKFKRNYLYPDNSSEIDNMTPQQRLRSNVEALEVVRTLMKEGREATAEEREVLGRYRGWGGVDLGRAYSTDMMRRSSTGRWGTQTENDKLLSRLADIIDELDPNGERGVLSAINRAALTSYYTPTAVAKVMNGFVELAGFKGGNMLDPSMGSGVFEGTMSKGVQQRTMIHGIELDWLTGQIARNLYPDANVLVTGYEQAGTADNAYDVVMSNIPFGDLSVTDKSWKHDSSPVRKAAQNRIHNYFAVKMLDNTRPGGLCVIMTSNAILDTKSNQIIRERLADQAEVLGVVRLPDNTFKGAGTSVVTDVIFLRKFKDEADRTATRGNEAYTANIEKPFLSSGELQLKNPTDGKTYKVAVNGYFAKNKDMMIGDGKAGGQYRADEFGLSSTMGTDDIAKFMGKLVEKKIIGDRKGKLFDTHKTEREVKQAVSEAYKGDGDYISSGNIVEQDGMIGVVTSTKNKYGDVTTTFTEMPSLKSKADRIQGMFPVRKAMKQLIDMQIQGEKEHNLSEVRAELQKAYDDFVKKYGRLNDKGNDFLTEDIDGYTLRSLEKYDDGKFVGLSDIFTKNTIKPALDLTTAKTPQDAISLSLAEYGEINPSFMEEVLGDSWAEQCGETLFKTPFTEDEYETADAYLSGDVKTKLEQARAAVKEDASLQRNVKALEAIQPKDIPFEDISIRMGARWIPAEIYTDFMYEQFGIQKHEYRNNKSGVEYMPEVDQYVVNVAKNELGGEADAWRTSRRSASEVFTAALQDKSLSVFDTIKEDGKETKVLNKEETELLNNKIQDLRTAFEDWIGQQPEREEMLMRLYNDKFNRTVLRKFDGSHLNVAGLMGKELRPHQKDAVWMLINNRGGIVDHIVGAGKTLVMQSSIMEMRRMGIAKKPMIIALKSTVAQIAKEFREAYPAARILAPTEKDFASNNRKKFMAQIALNDYDCVILSHDQYNMLPHTEEVERSVIDEQMAQLDNAIEFLYGQDDKSQLTKKQIKGLEKRKNNLETKLTNLLDRKIDREFTFEGLGVDYLFVDECQHFKSLPYVSTYDRIAGLGDKKGSQKAIALLNGVRYLQKMHQGDQGTVFLSGTTISNSLSEIYHLLNYLRPSEMERLGMTTFDAWAGNFAIHTAELEYGVTSELKEKDRFRSLTNIPELAKMYAEIADVRNDLNLKLPKPKMRSHIVTVPQTDLMQEINREIVNMVKGKDGSYFNIASNDNTPWGLLASTLSAKAAINPRLIDESWEAEGGKIPAVCENVKKIYDQFAEQKGTQLIFCDTGVPGKGKKYDAYTDIINRLVNDYGIPRKEIADIHVANTDEKRKELFAKVNDGSVRILIGGTKNMGTGVNVQKRIVAMHHVDVPWTPADREQREGRGVRQGNEIARDFNDDNVDVYFYATEGSLDMYKYQLQETKGKLFAQFKSGTIGDRTFDEGDAEENFDPAEVVAMLSGNPVIFEKSKQDKKVEKLRRAKRAYESDWQRRHARYEELQTKKSNFERLLSFNAGDVRELERGGFTPGADGKYPTTVTVSVKDDYGSRKTFDKPKEAGAYIHELLKQGKKVQLSGFHQTANISIPVTEAGIFGKPVAELESYGGIKYTVEVSDDDTAAGVVFRNLLQKVYSNRKVYERSIEDVNNQLKGADPGENAFPKQAELDEALKEKKRLDEEYKKLSDGQDKPSANDDTRYRDFDEDVNEQFNRELSELTEENADTKIFNLGSPSSILLSAGVEDKPMKLYGNKVIKKMKKHGFALEELQDLPKAVANPIAVFNNYQREGNRTILTELRSQGKNIMVAITLGKNGVDIDFNIVSSVFGKRESNVVDWINKGYLTYINKEKALNYLYFSERGISKAADNVGQEDSNNLYLSAPIAEAAENSELSSAAKIVKDFVNPSIRGEKSSLQGKIDPQDTTPQAKALQAKVLSEKLNTPIRVVSDPAEISELPSRRQQRAKGWWSTKNDEVVILLPNNVDAADVANTVVHEVVGHKGLRKLVGEERFDEFLNEVYDHASNPIRAAIDKAGRKLFDAEVDRLTQQKNAEPDRPESRKGVFSRAEATVEANKKREQMRREATEEYMADMAGRIGDEGFEKMGAEELTFWGKVKAKVQQFLDKFLRGLKIAKGVRLTDKDVAYILYKSWKNLRNGGKPTIMDAAEDALMRSKTHYDEISENDVMFRDGDSVGYRKAQARNLYEQRVSRGLYQMQEAIQDSMLGLKEAMEAILKAEGGYTGKIEDVAGYENPYLGENRLSSVNQAECSAFAQTLFKPMLEEVAKLAKTADERAKLTDYMMAKHGLERNNVMARRAAEKVAHDEFWKELKAAEHAVANEPLDQDAADVLADVKQRMQDRENELYAENRSRDYAGLTALTGKDDVADAESEAGQMVSDYEADHDTTALWDKVNAVTKATLQKTYECGIISKETFDNISDMYEHYIPLRGFDEKTSDEAYAYLSDRHSAFNAPVKTAKGRKSKADDPFANMEAMVESAIMQGNRNMLVKRKFMRFVQNHPSDLVSISDLWLRYDDVADEWKPVNAGDVKGTERIEEDDTPREVERKMRDFEEKMQQLSESDPDHFKRQKDHPEIPYRVIGDRDLRQHQVLVKQGGKDYVLTINGNPRAAQALNGQTNPDNDMSGALGAILHAAESVNRQLSAFYTTRNPDFIVSNFMRDMLYANTMVWVKESPNYALRFHKNFAKVNPAKMKVLFAKLRKGTLDMNDETEKAFSLFMANGGETGYSNIRDIEQRKNDIRRELSKHNGKLPIRKAWSLLGERLDEYNRAVENCARFAAFMTSRQMKRSIDRSIYDAKEISVNFNKKGSGAKFMNKTGQTPLGNAAALVSGLGRSGFVFWNAAIQGTTNFGRQFKRHPGKALAGAAAMFLLGALVAGIAGDDGNDGSRNSYYNLPEYVRRSNIMFRMPGMDEMWVSIPLPVEYRALYGMGELMMSAISGKEHYTSGELAGQIAGQVSQALPIDFMEGGGGFKAFVPSAVKPFAEVMTNKSWTGMPLYKDTPWNKDMPEWTKAYKSANKQLVGLSKVLNEVSGGDAYTSGVIDINPAQVEYLLNGYFGGVSSTIDKFAKMGETALGQREYDPRSFLILNRLVKSGDERTEYRHINNEYFRLKQEHDKLKARLKHYEEDTYNGVFDYAEKINWLNKSPEYQRLEIFEDYSSDINAINKELKEPMNDNEHKELEKELYGLKKKLVDEANKTRK